MNYPKNYHKNDYVIKESDYPQPNHIESFHPSHNFKLQPHKVDNSDSDQREDILEESDNNQAEDIPPSEVDISFEENNANFLKTRKYKMQSSQRQNNGTYFSQERESDDYYDSSNIHESNQSHKMSNYIEQLKKEKNSIGYKNQFEKKQNTNLPLKAENTHQNKSSRQNNKGNEVVQEYKEYQGLQQLKDNQSNLGYNNFNKGYKADSNSNQKGHSSNMNQNTNEKVNHQYNNIKENNTYNHKQNGQPNHQKTKQNNYQNNQQNKQQQRDYYNPQQEKGNGKQIDFDFNECEEKSEEYRSSSMMSSERIAYEKNNHSNNSQKDIPTSQPQSDLCQIESDLDENQYFTLENKSRIVESINVNNNQSSDIANSSNFNQSNFPNIQNIPQSQSSLFLSHVDKFSRITDSSQINRSNMNQSHSKPHSQLIHSSHDNLDQNDTQAQSYINSSYNGYALHTKGKAQNNKMNKSHSQYLMTSNSKNQSSFTVAQFGDDYIDDQQSPLHKLNVYLHSSGKPNSKQQSQEKPSNNNIEQANRISNDNLPIVNKPSVPLTQQPHMNTNTSQLIRQNNKNKVAQTHNILSQENLEKYQCDQKQTFHSLQENEKRFYQERKRSLERKFKELTSSSQHQSEQNSQRDNWFNNSNQSMTTMNKEEFLSVVCERLMLELRMTHKIISYLESQNSIMREEMCQFNISQSELQQKQQTLSHFVCTNCHSTSVQQEDNFTLNKTNKSQQQTSNFSNSSYSVAEKVLENSRFCNNENSQTSGMKKQNSFSNSVNQQNNSLDQSLHNDFQSLVKDFKNLKQMSMNQQQQIDKLEKQKHDMLQQTTKLQQEIKDRDTKIQSSSSQHEFELKNLIDELNKLTKENLDIREEFSSEIKKLKSAQAREFNELESKVKLTIKKKDDCIQKLNSIIVDLKS